MCLLGEDGKPGYLAAQDPGAFRQGSVLARTGHSNKRDVQLEGTHARTQLMLRCTQRLEIEPFDA